MAPGSKTGAGPAWLVGTPRHFTPSAALARSLGPPASSPAGAAEENKTILPCSSSLHTVGSYASSHTGGGAVSVKRGAVEVCQDARDRFSYCGYPSDFRCSNWQQNPSSPRTSPGVQCSRGPSGGTPGPMGESASSAAGLRGGGLPSSPGVQCSRGLCGGAPGSAAGQPAQPRVYAVAGPESATSDFSESFGQVMASTPLVGRRSRGIRGGPSRERPCAGPPAPPRDYAGRSECAGPSTSRALRVVLPSDGLDSPRMASAAAGRSGPSGDAQRGAASPAAGLRGGGLFHRVASSTASYAGSLGSSTGGRRSCG
jgi:hypothetical protein